MYYVDRQSGKIYVINNEDYWFNVKPYIQIIPKTTQKLGRIWYGWKGFAQGGINEAGVFFDGATTPEQETPGGYLDPNTNLEDDLLANCKSVAEAIQYLELRKVALKKAHIFLGDKTGNAVVIEWVEGKKHLVNIQNNYLIATNFLLSASEKGNHPCLRFQTIQNGIASLDKDTLAHSLKDIGNVMAKAVQIPQKDSLDREGGALYTNFINQS